VEAARGIRSFARLDIVGVSGNSRGNFGLGATGERSPLSRVFSA
jgi:hypothetical protein